MKLSKVVEMLESNTTLLFKVKNEGIFDNCLLGLNNGKLYWLTCENKSPVDAVSISEHNMELEYEIFKQPVDFMTAVKAWNDGKKIYFITDAGEKIRYEKHRNEYEVNAGVALMNTLKDWYIEESEGE